jgi:CheY-like chemotaxis protein
MSLGPEGSRPDVIRVLIVDDDAGLRTALLAIFGAHLRYSAQAATDAADGLARIESFRPHLVLLDLQRPGTDAAEVCRAVKASPAGRSTRILAMGGPSDEGAGQRLLAAGADAFLAKPFTLGQLEAEVARLT